MILRHAAVRAYLGPHRAVEFLLRFEGSGAQEIYKVRLLNYYMGAKPAIYT